jgi:hypothetical protein
MMHVHKATYQNVTRAAGNFGTASHSFGQSFGQSFFPTQRKEFPGKEHFLIKQLLGQVWCLTFGV